MFKKIINYLLHPKKLMIYLMNKNYFFYIPDKQFLKIQYRMIMGKKLDLDNPKTFNEKLQWLKLYDRKDIYTKMSDKFEAKKYVSNIIGNEYIIPTLAVYNRFEDIDFDALPNQFVIKCTHDSGGLIIVKDKKSLDIKKAKNRINKCLKRNYYHLSREWPYKNIKPKIIVEKYMKDAHLNTMRDYKFFCFNGKPQVMYISEGLENHLTASMSFFDMDYNQIDCKRRDYKLLNQVPKVPKNFDKMKEFASILSKGIPHLRVDFYEINDKLYFGELTFFTASGYIPFESDKWDKKLGNYIKLPLNKKRL